MFSTKPGMGIAVVIAVTAALAGCLSPAPPDRSNSSLGAPDGGEVDTWSWAPRTEALIRPGVRLDRDGNPDGECTASAVFTSTTNDTAYLSTSESCVPGVGQNATVIAVDGTRHPMTVTWAAYRHLDGIGILDVALLRIPNQSLVHPSVLSYDGPTSPATTDQGDLVSLYANATRRPKASQVDAVVWNHTEDGNVLLESMPVVPGDFGAPVLTSDGGFVGTFSSIVVGANRGSSSLTVCSPCEHVVSYQNIVDAAAKAGYNVTLATTPASS